MAQSQSSGRMGIELSLVDFINAQFNPTDGSPSAVNAVYLPRIIDALDDDGSGLVSVTEVNEFTREK